MDDEYTKESTYPELKAPHFESTISPVLLSKISNDEVTREILSQLSVISQHQEFQSDAVVNLNYQVRHTNGRLKRVEAWKEVLSSWYAMAAFLVGGVIVLINTIWGIIEIIKNFQ